MSTKVSLGFALALCAAGLACGNAQPESCKSLEATPGAGDACVIKDDCKAGGANYETAEGTSACDASCTAILENDVCFPGAE